MNKIIEKLLDPNFLPLQATITLALLYVFYIVIGKNLYDKFLSHRFDIMKLNIQNTFDQQGKFFIKKLEVETIKLNRVMPLLEDLNSVIMEFRMVYHTYMQLVVNKSNNLDWGKLNLENERVRIDGKFIEKLNLCSLYLPVELKNLLQNFRIIVSCSLNSPISLYNSFHAAGNYKPLEVSSAALNLIDDYINCFHDMTAKYLTLSDIILDYKAIAGNNNLTTAYRTSRVDSIYKAVEANLLRYEYSSSEEKEKHPL